MSKASIIQLAFLVFVGSVLLTLTIATIMTGFKYTGFVTGNESGCVVPYENMTITTDTTLCSGTYYLNDTDGDGVIIFKHGASSDIKLVCSNTIIIGDKSGQGIIADDGLWHNNISIIGCTLLNYREGIDLNRVANSTFENITVISSNYSNIFIQNANNIVFDNINCSYATDSEYGHGIYISAGHQENNTKNIIIKNSYIEHNPSGIHINGRNESWVSNITVYNTRLNANGIGINDFGCRYCNIYNNTIINSEHGLRLSVDGNYIGSEKYSGSKNNNYWGNTFTNSLYDDFWIRYGSTGNKIFNNTYNNNGPIIRIQDGSTYEIQIKIEEQNSKYMQVIYDNWFNDTITKNAHLNFTYYGYSNINIINNTIKINNQLKNFPYNDIKNTSNGAILASNINNYSITLAPNQEITVGNFTNKSKPSSLSPVNTTNTTKTNTTKTNTIINHPPNTPIVNVVSDASNINCSSTISDPDNDSMDVVLVWTKNGVDYRTKQSLNRTTGSYIIDYMQTNTQDTYQCRIQLFDGKNYSQGISKTIQVLSPINTTNTSATVNTTNTSATVNTTNANATVNDTSVSSDDNPVVSDSISSGSGGGSRSVSSSFSGSSISSAPITINDSNVSLPVVHTVEAPVPDQKGRRFPAITGAQRYFAA